MSLRHFVQLVLGFVLLCTLPTPCSGNLLEEFIRFKYEPKSVERQPPTPVYFGSKGKELLASQQEIFSTLLKLSEFFSSQPIKQLFDRLIQIGDRYNEVKRAEREGKEKMGFLLKEFLKKVFSDGQHESLIDLLDNLDAIYRHDTRLFLHFLVKTDQPEPSDTQQSQLAKLQRFSTGLKEIQHYGYKMYSYACSKSHKPARDCNTTSQAIQAVWSDREKLQAERLKQISAYCDSRFNPVVEQEEIFVKTGQFCFETPLSRVHYFKLTPTGPQKYDYYPNAVMIPYKSPTVPMIELAKTKEICRAHGDYDRRWVPAEIVRVSNLATQYICRLYFTENRDTDKPSLNVKADVCNKNNKPHIQIVDTIFSTNNQLLTVKWPYEIRQNTTIPSQFGYVVGVQFGSTANDQLTIQLHTSNRDDTEETNVNENVRNPWKPLKHLT